MLQVHSILISVDNREIIFGLEYSLSAGMTLKNEQVFNLTTE